MGGKKVRLDFEMSWGILELHNFQIAIFWHTMILHIPNGTLTFFECFWELNYHQNMFPVHAMLLK